METGDVIVVGGMLLLVVCLVIHGACKNSRGAPSP